ncbi:MAG: hypothetical protein WBW61_03395 [Rhodanobacteraceae bacterium]
MKKWPIALVAFSAALSAPGVRAGQLSLNAGFALAQNSDGGEGGSSVPRMHLKALDDVRLPADLDTAGDAHFLRNMGDGAVITLPDVDSDTKPATATTANALDPADGFRHHAAHPRAPDQPRTADIHRWQSLVPGAIK